MARYLGLLLLALCLETPIVAQETRTLLPSGFGSQGTGGINVLFTPLDDQWILMVGGSGGVRIGHSLVMGGGGYGFHSARRNVAGTDERLEGGYGGFLIEYSASPRRVAHVTTSALIGPWRRSAPGPFGEGQR